MNNFSKKEISLIKTQNTPVKVQEFVNSLEYNQGKRISIAGVLRTKKADCLEAAAFACFILNQNEVKAFLMDFVAVRDEDHVVCVFKENNLYGAIAQSKYLGLRFRNPVYKTLRELSMSYFDNYFNYYGDFGLKERGPPVFLPKKVGEWTFSSKWMIRIEKEFDSLKHIPLVPKNLVLPRASVTKFHREVVLVPKKVKIGIKYRKKEN